MDAERSGSTSWIGRSQRRAVWIMFFVYALVSIAGWIRMIEAVINWSWLSNAGVWPGPLYLVLTGGLWGLTGMTAVIWLWLRRPGARAAGFGAALFLALTYWADRTLVGGLDRYGGNTPFAIGLTLFGLLFAWAAFMASDNNSRSIKR